MDDCGDFADPITIAQYTAALAAAGETVLPGGPATYWQSFEMRSLARQPVFRLDVPPVEETRSVLWRARAPVATYVRPPDADHPQNAWLYVCENQHYRIEDLTARARRDIRRALRQLRIEFVDVETFLQQGVKCFCDSRARVGLSDGTPEAFRQTYKAFAGNSAHRVLGAWAGDSLAAYMTLVIVDDWVDICVYAADDYLKSCPNNGLIHFALDLFLTRHKFRVVNYGLSSIQEVSGAEGLHAFKKKVGFECRPVHRAFIFHPLLRPFANSLTLWGLRACRRLRPHNPALRKAAGLLATYLGQSALPEDSQESHSEAAQFSSDNNGTICS